MSQSRYNGSTLLVLLHGLGCASTSFDCAFTAPCLRKYSLYAPDFPGHGGAAPEASVTDYLPHCAGLVRAGISQARREHPWIREVVIAGHSMGGAVAIMAAQYEAIISIDGNLVAQDCGLVSRKLGSLDTSGFTWELRLFIRMLQESGQESLRTWARWLSAADPETVRLAAQSLVRWSDSNRLLSMFREPRGRAYLYGDADDRQYVTSRMPTSTLIERIPHSGHFTMIDNPGGFCEALARILGQL